MFGYMYVKDVKLFLFILTKKFKNGEFISITSEDNNAKMFKPSLKKYIVVHDVVICWFYTWNQQHFNVMLSITKGSSLHASIHVCN